MAETSAGMSDKPRMHGLSTKREASLFVAWASSKYAILRVAGFPAIYFKFPKACVPTNKVEVASPFMIWPQKSHKVTWAAFCWLQMSHKSARLNRGAIRQYLLMRKR